MVFNEIRLFDTISKKYVNTFYTETKDTLIGKIREQFTIERSISEQAKNYEIHHAGYFDDNTGQHLGYITRQIKIPKENASICISQILNLGNAWKTCEKNKVEKYIEVLDTKKFELTFLNNEKANILKEIEMLRKKLENHQKKDLMTEIAEEIIHDI